MKILLSAYSCLPTTASEPGNAWRTINDLLRDHEVWAVIEESRHAQRIVAHLANHPMPGFHPVFMSVRFPFESRLVPGEIVRSVHYSLWQTRLLKTVEALHTRIGFDLCQHITFGRYWSPSGLRTLDLPFVWGPVGAAERPPRPFVDELPADARLFEFVRDHVRSRARGSRALLATAKAATIAIGVTEESCGALKSLGARRVEMLPQMALTDDELDYLGSLPQPTPGPLQALCIGRLLHWKGFHLAIRAFSRFARASPESELWIVGDGPYRRQLEKVATATGIRSRVRFLGWLPSHSEVMKALARSHVLLHPALHEGFGNVCLEALAAGRPVACVNIGGPATQMTRDTGFVAPATRPEEAVEAMASFLVELNSNRSLLASMSVRAKARARAEFSMARVRSIMKTLYSEAVWAHRENRAHRI
jgi:glycosyltransferase involved in cell wall biosynthesis